MRLEPGMAFCPECGSEVTTGMAEAPAAVEPHRAVEALRSKVGTRADNGMPQRLPERDEAQRASGGRARRAPVRARKEAPATPSPSAASDCEHLHVLYNAGCVFVEGLTVPFEFRITPLADGVTEVFVEIRSGTQMQLRYESPYQVRRGMTMEMPVAFRPPQGVHGKVPFEIFIGYTVHDQEHRFLAHKKHTIYRAQEQMRRVIDNLHLEVRNDISQGNAADVNINQHFKELSQLVNPENPARELEFVDIPPLWQELPLQKCFYRPPIGHGTPRAPAARPNARHPRLSLTAAGLRLHLLSDQIVQMGRHGTNDIIARVADERGGFPEESNAAISRYHCRIEAGDSACRLIDGAYYPGEQCARASTCGTFLDGVRITPAGGAVALPLNTDVKLTLAATETSGAGACGFSARVVTCGVTAPLLGFCPASDPPGQLSCAILRALHRPHDTFVLLWKRLPLQLLDPALAGWCMCRLHDGFALKTAHGCEWLVPGATLTAAGRQIQVQPYREPR
jgi:hypothetical protein